AIAEFKVQTDAFDAQSGQTAGAVVNLALKSGTNSLRGNLSYFNRSDARSATPLLSERAGAEKPTRSYNRVTGTVSGPLIKDRTFFMLSGEHLRDVQPEPATYTVPPCSCARATSASSAASSSTRARPPAAPTSARPSRATSSRPAASTRSPPP